MPKNASKLDSGALRAFAEKMAVRPEKLVYLRADLAFMKAGLRIPDRTQSHFTLQLVARGTTMRSLGNAAEREIESRSGSLIFLAPGVRHTFHYSPGSKVFTVWISAGGFPKNPSVDQGHIHLDHMEGLVPFFQMLSVEFGRGPKRPYRTLRIQSLASLILTGMLRRQVESGSKEKPLDDVHLVRFSTYVRHHQMLAVSAADLAAVVGFSPEYFTKLFTRSYGQSPRTFILREKMSGAANVLLETDWSIEKVAASCGYESVYSFSRLFKSVLGQSPMEYRRMSSVT
jgi:AraC-like DNA-binding protein/quercetin dioxygenase-like cupin family protein